MVSDWDLSENSANRLGPNRHFRLEDDRATNFAVFHVSIVPELNGSFRWALWHGLRPCSIDHV